MKKSLIIVLFLAAIAVGLGRRFVPSHSFIGPETVLHFKLWNGLMITNQVFDYSFNGTTGEFFDGDDPITLINTYPGFYFDGTEDHIYTNATYQTTFDGSFSMMAWVKPDDGRAADYQVIIGAIHDTTPLEDVVHVSIQTTGKVRFTYETNDDAAYAEESVASFANGQGEWTHIAVVATADTSLRIYVNGAIQTLGDAPADGDATGQTFADFVTDGDINVGGLNSDTTHDGYHSWFGGLISDVRIISKALSVFEIRDIYNTTRWRFQQ